MHQTSELTVVLRAREGESLFELAPFLKVGSTVAIGRSGALVSAVSTGNQIAEAQLLENQVLLAESAMRRGTVLPGEHRGLFGELYQILGALDAPAHILDQVSAAIHGEQLPLPTLLPFCPVTQDGEVLHIDDRVRMVTDARRYSWLRDKTRVADMDTDLCAARENKCFFGAELDTEIDNGMRLARLEEMHSCAQ